MTISVRLATCADVRAIASVHALAWQWAYDGLMPNSVLRVASARRREAVWHRTLTAALGTTTRVWVAEQSSGIVGFIASGAPQNAGYARNTAEVYTLYQLQEVAKTGVACRLMIRALDDLRASGFRLAILWVLEANARARQFYERGGWRTDGVTQTEMLGRFVLREVRYAMDLSSSRGSSLDAVGGLRSSIRAPSARHRVPG